VDPISVPNVGNVIAVEAAADESFAILGNGSVLSWGSNFVGLLGWGDTGRDEGDPPGYVSGFGPDCRLSLTDPNWETCP
jgi:alpha-tubulin suppressor-like RCC1 family protein